MKNIDPVTLVLILIVGFVILIGLLIILRRIFVNVGPREIAIKERRYLGRRMPPGRVVATEGEVGIQADVLKPGLHFLNPFTERLFGRPVPLIEIGADEMALSKPSTENQIFRVESSRPTARRMLTTTFRIQSRSLSAVA